MSLFRRPHYEKIGEILRDLRPALSTEHSDVRIVRTEALKNWEHEINKFADVFAEDNENFDRAQFITYCWAK